MRILLQELKYQSDDPLVLCCYRVLQTSVMYLFDNDTNQTVGALELGAECMNICSGTGIRFPVNP